MWKRDFVDCLEGSTVGHSRLDEALAIKQKHMPKRVYKYRHDCDYARDNLMADTVWLCSPDSYNDPYDCVFKLSNDPLVVAIKTGLVDTFVNGYSLQQVVSPDQIENAKKSQEPLETIVSYIPEFWSKAQGSHPKMVAERCTAEVLTIVDTAFSTIRQWRKLTKLCSFSAICDSVLMWSHYADNHQGFCLEYDVEGLGADHPFRKYLYPVIYSAQLYDLTPWAKKLAIPDRQEFNVECPLLGVLHKFEGWKYEEEWRLVEVTDIVREDHNYPAPTPTRIFLGSRMEGAKKIELRDICEKKNIEVHQMRLANDRFQLLPEPDQGT